MNVRCPESFRDCCWLGCERGIGTELRGQNASGACPEHIAVGLALVVVPEAVVVVERPMVTVDVTT